jgi:hypothetical protein
MIEGLICYSLKYLLFDNILLIFISFLNILMKEIKGLENKNIIIMSDYFYH